MATNKMVIGHKTYLLGRNHPMVITVKYGLHNFTGYGENAI